MANQGKRPPTLPPGTAKPLQGPIREKVRGVQDHDGTPKQDIATIRSEIPMARPYPATLPNGVAPWVPPTAPDGGSSPRMPAPDPTRTEVNVVFPAAPSRRSPAPAW